MSDLAVQMQADALEAQRFSRKYFVLELDFSESSVELLEGEVDSVEFALQGGKSDTNVDDLTRIWGAYLGEALRRRTGGRWIRDEAGQIQLEADTRTLHPHEQVRRRLNEGAAFNLAEYYRQALQVSED